MKKEMTIEEKETIVKAVGKEYRRCRQRMDLVDINDSGSIDLNSYKSDCEYVYTINRILQDCSRNTQLIIRHDYLMVREKEWFLGFFSKSTYYRLKKRAIEEFVSCLNI